ncbi:hypothetical protein [Streptomyces sichuanensis]|nr:hypothetical protein [Streptomyces sichuanensis]
MSAWAIVGFLLVGGATAAWLVRNEGAPGRRGGRHRGGDAR